MAPPDGAAAIAQGAVDMACGWGGALRRMKEHGNVLLTGAEKEALGILVFDVTCGPAAFVAENGDLVAKFLKVTADANAMWNSGEHTARDAAGDRQGCGHGRGGDARFHGHLHLPEHRGAAVAKNGWAAARRPS